jgi:hypothetical protein
MDKSNNLSALLNIYEYELDGYTRCLYGVETSGKECIRGKLWDDGNKSTISNLTLNTDLISISPENASDCGLFKVIGHDTIVKSENDEKRTRSCDLFDGIILPKEENNRKNREEYNNLPEELLFNIQLDEYNINSNDLFHFLQSYGSKLKTNHFLSDVKNSSLRIFYDIDFFNSLMEKLKICFCRDTNLRFNPNHDETQINHKSVCPTLSGGMRRTRINTPQFNLSLTAKISPTTENKLKIPFNETYIKVLKPNINDKFIIMGDLHGSFSTLVRNLFRFKKMNIINENFGIKSEYNIIFLGDILDRGKYSYECIVLISLLKILNPNQVFINRGNHEEFDLASRDGTLREMEEKFNSGEQIFNDLIHTLNLSHSAIMIKDPITQKWIWLSHGGIPINKDSNKIIQEIKNISVNDLSDQKISDEYSTQIRWNDWSSELRITPNRRGVGVVLGKNIMENMKLNNIYLAIRAHQDNDYNTKILTHKFNDPVSMHLIMGESYSNQKCKGYINTFYLNNKDELKLEKMENPNDNILPVITLSTNTDYERNLNRDSFAILLFSPLVPSESENIIECEPNMTGGNIYKNKYQKYYYKVKKII